MKKANVGDSALLQSKWRWVDMGEGMSEQFEIARYFEELRVRLGVVDETKKEVDRLIAPDFSLFSILWVDEVRLSNMIATLLDPSGAHGQGRKFLNAFFDVLRQSTSFEPALHNLLQIEHSWSNSRNIKVELERSTDMIEASQRRMDILIHNDDYALMIENKPWAVDQFDQLPDYGKHLAGRFEGYAMIYLSGDGSPPSADSFSTQGKVDFDLLVRSGNVLSVAFRPHLTDWLSRCLVLAEADRVRWIIKDFFAFIEASFPMFIAEKMEQQ